MNKSEYDALRRKRRPKIRTSEQNGYSKTIPHAFQPVMTHWLAQYRKHGPHAVPADLLPYVESWEEDRIAREKAITKQPPE